MEAMTLKTAVQDYFTGKFCTLSVDLPPRIYSVGFRKGQRGHVERRKDTLCRLSSCDPTGTSSLLLHVAGMSSAELLLSTRVWTGSIDFCSNRICRNLHQRSDLKDSTRSKIKKSTEDGPSVIPRRELLAQVRSRKRMGWLRRVHELSRENGDVLFPFWRKKTKAELEERRRTMRVMELRKRKQLDNVFKLVEEAKKEKEPLSIIFMNAVIEACVHCDDIDRAVAVYQEMLQPGCCGVDNITYGTLLKGLGKVRRLDDAFELTDAIEAGTAPGCRGLSEVHLHTLLNACVEAGDTLRARGVLLRYRSSIQGARPSVLTYNLLIKGYARSDNPLEALKLKDEMLVLDVKPQRLTYNSFILACVRGGDMERAFDHLAEMKDEARRLQTSELLPDVVTYTTLLKGLADRGDSEAVSSLVSEMRNSPTCVLDRVAYTAIIDAFIDSGQPREGLCVMQEMQERAKVDPHFKPRAHVFLSLMRAFAVKGEMKVVTSLRQQLVPESGGKVCPEDRAEADELMIETAVNAGQLGVAKHVLKLMTGIKKGIPLSKRAHMVVVRLQVLLGFSHDLLFKPFLLKPGVSPYDTVETVMLPYKMARPLPGDLQLKNVIMRFFKEDAVPVINEHGACMGVVYSEDCCKIDVRLRDIMRGPPPAVTNSTLIVRAVSLLLEPQTKVVVVVSSRTIYSADRSFSSEIPLGFVTRGSIFRGDNYQVSVDKELDQLSKNVASSQTLE